MPEDCKEILVKYVRECVGCVDPKQVTIYKNTCEGYEYYYDKNGQKQRYYNNRINWEMIK